MSDAPRCGFDLGALATELRHAAAFVAANSWQSLKKGEVFDFRA